MKADLHPKNYRLVVFKDLSNDYSFITRSCIESKETIKHEDGNEYPLIKLEISHNHFLVTFGLIINHVNHFRK